MLFMQLSLLNLAYLIAKRPFVSGNILEIFNEMCILAFAYTLIIFTDFTDDIQIRESGGYLAISFILLNFCTNILLIAFRFIQ